MNRGAWCWMACVVSAVATSSCGQRDDAAFVPRGHQELVVLADATAVPVFTGKDSPIQACLSTALEDDTSQWEARWQVDNATPREFVRPSVRLGRTICFDTVLADRVSDGPHRLCSEVRDAYDQRAVTRGCLDIEYRATDAAFDQLKSERGAILNSAGQDDAQDTVAALLSLCERAEQGHYPLSAFKLRLIAIYQLRRRGTLDAVNQAGELLGSRPAWLASPAAAGAAAMLSYEEALMSLERRGDDRAAWRDLRTAEDLYASLADPSFVAVALKQADILARAGAVQEARTRLATVLQRCDAGPCRADLLPSVRTTLAWVILLDPDAEAADLQSAKQLLQVALSSGSASLDLVERANIWTNLAYAQARCGEPFEHALLTARQLLDGLPLEALSRAREVRSWTDLVEGLAELIAGQDARALVACSQASRRDSPQLEAWAAGCRARAWTNQGALDKAAKDYDSALSAHLRAAPTRAGADLSLGLGRRADDFYEAARLELQRGHLRQGWELLEALDLLSIRGVESRDPSLAAPQPDTTRQIGRELSALRQPVATGTRQARNEAGVQWRDRAQESLRDHYAARQTGRAADRAIEFRAIALANEVLLLQQRADGEVVLSRRTPWPRTQLRASIDAVRKAMEQGNVDDQRWFALTRRLAAALVPESSQLEPVTTVALHGVLQSVPLAALPLFEATTPGSWLLQKTVVALVPAQARAVSGSDQVLEATPLFVVDPSENLKGSHQHAIDYKQQFANGQLLEGKRATRDAVSRAIGGSRWLHLDAHAIYDNLFPELSTIELADGPVLSADLESWGSGLQFVNLSACGTGRWHETADSGRYGIAGDLARGGVPWVVAALTDLPDAVAGSFNGSLYACLSGSGSIPSCYGDAVRAVAAKYQPAAWAGLMLIHAPADSSRENTGSMTPLGAARDRGAQP